MISNKKFNWFLAILLTFILSNKSDATDNPKPKIFILHSYENNHTCGQPQHDGIISVLKDDGYVIGKNFDLKVYYMDTKKTNNTPELIAEQASIALKQINSFQPDILVTLDDNAFRTVALPLVDSEIAIVFSGLNGQPEDYHKKIPSIESRQQPGHNITGVYEKLHVIDAIKVHSHIIPNLKKIRIFVDTCPTGRAIKKQIEIELKNNSLECDFELKVVKNWEEYQKEILESNEDSSVGAIYPIALLLKDKNGNTLTAPEIFKWTTENSTKSELALNYSFTDLGLFGGAAVDFFSMGEQAGKMVVKIIKGESPGNIPIENAYRYALAFNMIRAKQLNISIPQEILLAADKIVTEKSKK